MAAVINRDRIEKYLNLDLNVLFIGLHGVGKTAVIKEVMNNRFGNRWKYFSSATLDPWVDFVGVPKTRIDENGEEVLELIRPKFIKYDEVEALVFDEYNRAPDKIINATMELIQFKSINGHRLNNLKVVWAMINPEDEDDTYSVNHIDPAQLDRFHVHYNVPYMIDEAYFNKKYPATGSIFCQWWKNLPGDVQKLVSPRRVDYAAEAYSNDCRLEDFLPSKCGIKILRDALKSMPFLDQIKQVNSEEEAKEFLSNVNNATKLLDLVKMNDSISIDFFTKYGKSLPKELVEPFIDFVNARKQGLDVITSIEELIEKLPNDKGDQNTAAIINNVELDLLYKNGGNLENDLRALASAKHNLVAKLSNRCIDVLITCQKRTVERIMWGMKGPIGNEQTNFHKIIVVISKIGGFITPSQSRWVNKKLYENGIVKDMNYL